VRRLPYHQQLPTPKDEPRGWYFHRVNLPFYKKLVYLLMLLLAPITLGASLAWAQMDRKRLWFEQANFGGNRASFKGMWMQYMAIGWVNLMLRLVTLDMWGCCGCASYYSNTWLDAQLSAAMVQQV